MRGSAQRSATQRSGEALATPQLANLLAGGRFPIPPSGRASWRPSGFGGGGWAGRSVRSGIDPQASDPQVFPVLGPVAISSSQNASKQSSQTGSFKGKSSIRGRSRSARPSLGKRDNVLH